MEPPPQVNATTLADYLEVLSRAVFQSGMSWKVVEAKWPGFREAFCGFDPKTIAEFTPDDLDRLTSDPRIIRNRRKIEATVHNARALIEIDREYGGFGAYLRSRADFLGRVADLKRRFKHLGGFGAYYVLYVLGEPVPDHDEAQKLLRGEVSASSG